MASSWHLLKGRELHMDLVRLGAALYGQQRIVAGTRPAARWLTRIARIKKARLARRPPVSGGLPWQWTGYRTGYRALRRERYARLCALCCTGSGAAWVLSGCPRPKECAECVRQFFLASPDNGSRRGATHAADSWSRGQRGSHRQHPDALPCKCLTAPLAMPRRWTRARPGMRATCTATTT